jgi:hypothetical protein
MIVFKEFLAHDNSAREKSELESFPWVTKTEGRATALDVSQGQNLRSRLTVADVCCLLVGCVYGGLVSLAEQGGRGGLVAVFCVDRGGDGGGVDFRAVEGSGRSEGCGRRVKRGWARRRARRVEFATASAAPAAPAVLCCAVLCCAVREADARFTRCACFSLLVVGEGGVRA